MSKVADDVAAKFDANSVHISGPESIDEYYEIDGEVSGGANGHPFILAPKASRAAASFMRVVEDRESKSERNAELVLIKYDKEAMGSSQMESLHHEINILKRIGSQNIFPLIRSLESDKLFYIVSEYSYGEPLLEYVHRQPKYKVVEQMAMVISRDICSAVATLHRNGIAHRNLNFANVIFNEEIMRARVIGFDSAMYFERD